MNKKPFRIVSLVLLIVIFAGSVALCTYPDAIEAPPTLGTQPPPSNGAGTFTPDPENILRFGATGDGIGGVFNPILATGKNDKYVASLVFESLATSSSDALSGNLTSKIADWELSHDKRTYTFKLKDGITFSDGTPMTAQDVAFTYKTLAHPDYNGVYGYAVADLEGYATYRAGETDVFSGIEVIDEKTIAFRFREDAISAANITLFTFGIMPEHYYAFDAWEDFLAKSAAPVGSSWFTLEEYVAGGHAMLSRNRGYWNPDEMPYIDGILMTNVSEDDLQNTFLSGELDLAVLEPEADTYSTFSNMQNVTVMLMPANSFNYMQFNTTIPQLEDRRVRQALLYAIDRDAFVEAIYGEMPGDFGHIGMYPIAAMSWAGGVSTEPKYSFDMEKAAELMDEAGWLLGKDGLREKDGLTLTLTWLMYDEADWVKTLFDIAAEPWRELGVGLTGVTASYDEVIDRINPAVKEFDIYTMGWSMGLDPDPSASVFGLDDASTGHGRFNASGWYDEDCAKRMEEAKKEFDQSARLALYSDISEKLSEYVPTAIISMRYELLLKSDRLSSVDMPGLLQVGAYIDWTHHVNRVTLSPQP